MAMVELKVYCCTAFILLCWPIYGQISNLPEKDSASTQKITVVYEKFVIKCDTTFLGFTAIYPSEWGITLVQGENKPENKMTSDLFLMVKESLRLIEYVVNNKIDTLNNVKWLNCDISDTENKISVLKQKAMYSYILSQFNESAIMQDGYPCVRLLIQEGYSSGSYKWSLFKLLFKIDSIAFLKKEMKLDNYTMEPYSITKSYLDYNAPKIINLNRNLKKLQSFNSIVLLGSDSQEYHYPFLLEYFDGSESKVYIFRNKKDIDKDLRSAYGKVINLIWNL